MPTVREQVEAAVNVVIAIRDTIKEAGPEGAPSGVLYLACMNILSLDQYQEIIQKMIELGAVRQSNHVLYWIQQDPPPFPSGKEVTP